MMVLYGPEPVIEASDDLLAGSWLVSLLHYAGTSMAGLRPSQSQLPRRQLNQRAAKAAPGAAGGDRPDGSESKTRIAVQITIKFALIAFRYHPSLWPGRPAQFGALIGHLESAEERLVA
jgi:hypothetical protein